MFVLYYRPPAGGWYVHSHKLYDTKRQAREKAAKFLTKGTPIAIVEVTIAHLNSASETVG